MSETIELGTPGWRRGFWCLMATQFQTAFSDNALKNLVILLVLGSALPVEERDTRVALAGALFAAPFILFSMLGGWLADRFSKPLIMGYVKLAEIGIMLFAALALAWGWSSLELAAIFLMGCHSAVFAPSKYGVLPELLPHDRLSWGNGILELLTFLGIIFGIAAAGLLAETFAGHQGWSGLLLAALAVIGWACSRGICRLPAANPGCAPRINPVTDLWARLRLMRLDRDLWRACWGNTGFFFVAALVQMNLMIYGQDVLRLTQAQNAYLTLALALGIGVGSVAAGYASRGTGSCRSAPPGSRSAPCPWGSPGSACRSSSPAWRALVSRRDSSSSRSPRSSSIALPPKTRVPCRVPRTSSASSASSPPPARSGSPGRSGIWALARSSGFAGPAPC